MSNSPTQPTISSETTEQEPRDAAYWAHDITTLKVTAMPAEAVNLNVEGKRVVGPLQGFGPMWQKTYRVRLRGSEAGPVDVIKAWKENFSRFWPAGNRFYAPITGIAPGEVAVLNLSMGGMPLSTGVLVLYADDESFTLMTPQGHMLAGWITFSAYKKEGDTVAQVQVLMRANDPMYEIGLRLFGHKQEDKFWQHTLTSLARHFGVEEAVETQNSCVDPKLQWSHAKNIWHNAAMRTAVYTMATPVRWLRKRGRG
jgi:hypothetical protein